MQLALTDLTIWPSFKSVVGQFVQKSSMLLSLQLFVSMVSVFSCMSCGRSPDNVSDTLNIYGWADYRDEILLTEFARTTGIKVRYDVFDSSDVAEAKLLVGSTGYDVVNVANPYLGLQIPLGLYEELDRSRLPSWGNQDKRVLNWLAPFDPGNRHAIAYVWGLTGTIYNVRAVAARMKSPPLDRLSMFFDPEVASKFSDCGISIFDAPLSIYQMVFAYLGRDPNEFTDANLDAAQHVLLQVRPYIRRFDTSNWAQAALSGDICVAMGWPGTMDRMIADIPQTHRQPDLKSVIPEGSELYFDNLAILKSAPHKAAAYRYLEFMLDAHHAADYIKHIRYAVANSSAEAFTSPDILRNPDVYPSQSVLDKAHQQMRVPEAFRRKVTRYWEELKASSGK